MFVIYIAATNVTLSLLISSYFLLIVSARLRLGLGVLDQLAFREIKPVQVDPFIESLVI
jgi:hypothetical protein